MFVRAMEEKEIYDGSVKPNSKCVFSTINASSGSYSHLQNRI